MLLKCCFETCQTYRFNHHSTYSYSGIGSIERALNLTYRNKERSVSDVLVKEACFNLSLLVLGTSWGYPAVGHCVLSSTLLYPHTYNMYVNTLTRRRSLVTDRASWRNFNKEDKLSRSQYGKMACFGRVVLRLPLIYYQMLFLQQNL